MITALAFVPPEDVVAYFEILSIEIEAVFPSLQPILDWLESHYIGMLRREGVRRIPAFPIPTWNLYREILLSNNTHYLIKY
ncbi:MULE domain-containing protein [Aphis craccivora]|uniref:MULE domain-containing protein n=1 Tax=Aphis craccivora TaxID=307492 RepID=A0A6G0VLL4_APHCR|nr:MULE domain-containing protein [Aphis craccivora]